jgi:hypothetical protein
MMANAWDSTKPDVAHGWRFKRKELAELFAPFDPVTIDWAMRTSRNERACIDEWLVMARK